jgi:hypothetical protein
MAVVSDAIGSLNSKPAKSSKSFDSLNRITFMQLYSVLIKE